MGCAKLVASAKYFHPEIPMVVLGTQHMEDLQIPLGQMHPVAIKAVMEHWGYSTVIYIDADSIICGKLTELFDAIEAGIYEFIGVRNNNDFDKAGCEAPIAQYGAPIPQYLNAGLVATGEPYFIKDWIRANKEYANIVPFQEQSVLNNIAENYNYRILDPKESNVYYGVSGLYGTETHWDSWKEIEVVDGALMLNGKTVKVLHHAGGKKENKLDFDMFSEAAKARLIEITSTP